jgi:phosphoglycolate phosphatase-like HAD superfamily hydrolase
VKILIAGRDLILDFDGTLARLDVAWDDLRRKLGVRRIDDLWGSARDPFWAEVTAAEVAAARRAVPIPAVSHLLRATDRFAILTSNSAEAVGAFLERFPELQSRVAVVVGREALGGPKTEFDVFERGFRACLATLGTDRTTYIGDRPYELEFARRLGAEAVGVASLDVSDS